MRLLCVGLNPSLYSADAGVGFARPGNRFWPAMLAAGVVAHATRSAGRADRPRHRHDRPGQAGHRGRAAELTVDEYRSGLDRLDRLAAWLCPAVVCVIGLDGWRKVVDRRAGPGWHARGVGGRPPT